MKFNESNLNSALEHITHISDEKRVEYIDILNKAIHSISVKGTDLTYEPVEYNAGICTLLEILIGRLVHSMEEEDMDHDDYNALEEVKEEYYGELISLLRLIITPYDLNFCEAEHENEFLDNLHYSPLFTDITHINSSRIILNPEWYTERVKMLHSMKALLELDITESRIFLQSVIPDPRYSQATTTITLN